MTISSVDNVSEFAFRNFYSVASQPGVIPLPGTLPMLLSGLALVGVFMLRRQTG